MRKYSETRLLDFSLYFLQHMVCVLQTWRCMRLLLPLSWHYPTPSLTQLPAQSTTPCLSHTYCPNSAVPGGRESVSVTQNWFVLAATLPLWDTDVNSLYVFPNLSINPNQPKWSHAMQHRPGRPPSLRASFFIFPPSVAIHPFRPCWMSFFSFSPEGLFNCLHHLFSSSEKSILSSPSPLVITQPAFLRHASKHPNAGCGKSEHKDNSAKRLGSVSNFIFPLFCWIWMYSFSLSLAATSIQYITWLNRGHVI